jgi:hypothetical protein
LLNSVTFDARRRAAGVVAVLLVLTGCKPAGTHYYPLEASHWWHYGVHDAILDERHHHRYLMHNAGRAAGTDNNTYLQTAQSGSADFLRYRGAGVERIARLRPGMRSPQAEREPHVLLPDTLSVGTTWKVTSTLALAESRTFEPRDRIIARRLPVELHKQVVSLEAEVEVPAGRFEACLLIQGQGQARVPTDRGNGSATVSVEVREWYAAGVGLIKLERSEHSTSSFLKSGQQRWELLDYGH